jgi:hypothetical protein
LEPIPYPGCYQCPRCNSRDVYIGEKTLSATAITVNTAGPVDPTFITANKIDVHRCRNCNTEADYIYHPRKKAEIRQQRLKSLKIAGVVLVVILVLNGLAYGADRVKGAVSASRAQSLRTERVKEINSEYVKWVAYAKKCNFMERIDKYSAADGSPLESSISVAALIEPASELPKFWDSEKGTALDCLTQKLVEAPLSQLFTYSNQEIGSLNQFDGKYLFDETFENSAVRGVLGKGKNYQGYISFGKADKYHKQDYFFIYVHWQFNPLK